MSALTLVHPAAKGRCWPSPFGMAKLAKFAFDGCDLLPLREEMLGYLRQKTFDSAMLLDLSAVEQYLGNRTAGLDFQAMALEADQIFQSSWAASARALRVLAFAAPGEIGINTPIEFLVQGSDVVLYTLYVIPGQQPPTELPEHDVAIVTVSEWDRNRPVMREIEAQIAAWPCPVVNRPTNVGALARDQAFRVLDGVPGLVMPATVCITRSALDQLAQGAHILPGILPEGRFPLIVRPVESMAGRGLAKLDGPAMIAAYLSEHPEDAFFISPFIDYSSPDGFFRKYRVVMIEGRAYPCHMAVADEWAVWYLNAGMALNPARRAEEARFMEGFDRGFGCRHGAALTAIAERFGLEYFALDCAELSDGRLLVFEASSTMIVHDMDPEQIFPYKAPRMRAVFAAFVSMLEACSRR